MPHSSNPRALLDRLLPAAGGLLGGLFFIWIVGIRVVNPTEYNWAMQLDWRIHFLGWHFFRREPWMWPPGRIDGYFHAPDGTTIGFTDSIPLMAFLFKPFSDVLPPTFQYLGLWLLICFVLQGVFGVLIARLWTTRRWLQLLSASLFILMPTLLIRVGHPSLSSHFLLLWALWLYLRGEPGLLQPSWQQGGLGLIAGLTHPYIAVMVVPMIGALAIKDRIARAAALTWRRRWQSIGGFCVAVLSVLVGWWASGLFTVSGAENLASEGLGSYSLNILAPITPSGWSTLLPEWPTAAWGQPYEGFQYFGAGILFLIAVAGVVAVINYSTLPWRHMWPLLILATAFACYALSPRATLGDSVLFDLSSPDLNRWALFRATARFFWPPAYLVLAAAVALTVRRLPPRIAFVVLSMACVIQLVDLREAHQFRRVAAHSESLHAHRLTLNSPVWSIALPHYAHMVMLFPQQCGQAATPFEWPAFLAGLHGLTINAGQVARYDQLKVETYCRDLGRTIAEGRLADDTIYLVNSDLLERLRARAAKPLVCSVLDSVPVCVTEQSFQAWRHKVPG